MIKSTQPNKKLLTTVTYIYIIYITRRVSSVTYVRDTITVLRLQFLEEYLYYNLR